MIPKEELMIDNYVLWNDEIACISQLHELEVCFKCGDYGFYQDLKPILLTSRLLKHIGYKQHRYIKYYFEGHKFDLIFQNEKFCTLIDYNKMPSYINSLHELQNIYYWLNNKKQFKIKDINGIISRGISQSSEQI